MLVKEVVSSVDLEGFEYKSYVRIRVTVRGVERVETDRFLRLMRINQSKLVHSSGRFHVWQNAVEQLFLALAVHKDDRDAAPNVLSSLKFGAFELDAIGY